MKILCVNDDGIHATGLAVLERMARHFSDDVWVVALETEQSGASRALRLPAPIRVRQEGPKRFAVTGTPTDCVLLGVQELITGARPDLVLSGVHCGQNMAEDVTFSGAIAGATKGMQLGISAIALSQTRGLREGAAIAWDTAERHAPGVIAQLLAAKWPDSVVMTVNVPDCDPDAVRGVQATRHGKRDQLVIHADKRTGLRGETYDWLGFRGRLSDPPEGVDLHAVYHHSVSLTPLHMDLTAADAMQRLRDVLA